VKLGCAVTGSAGALDAATAGAGSGAAAAALPAPPAPAAVAEQSLPASASVVSVVDVRAVGVKDESSSAGWVVVELVELELDVVVGVIDSCW